MIQTKNAGIIKNADKIYCTFGYSKENVSEIKSVNGSRWKPDKKYWELPLNTESCLRLKDFKYGFTDDLKTWFDSQQTSIIKTETINKISKIDGLKGVLFPYQLQGVNFIENKNGRALIADEMGLGKTLQALAWLQLHKNKVPCVIVCPASLKLNWFKEILNWTTFKESDIQIISGTKIYKIQQSIIIINYDIVKEWAIYLSELNSQILILDESHYIKNKTTQRFKGVSTLAKKIPNVLALTGTPIENRPLEILSTINLLNPNIFQSEFKFKMRYCDGKHNGYGWDFNGASNLQELNSILRDKIMIRRKKADVLTELPDKLYQFVPFEIDNEKEYKLAEQDFISFVKNEVEINIRNAVRNFMTNLDVNLDLINDEKLERLKNEKASKANLLSQISKLKQLAAKGKIKQAIEWITNFLESGEKLIIFCEHIEIMDLIQKEFKNISVRIDGSVSLQKRNEAVEAFQNNKKIKIFIGNSAAETGLTLTAASNVMIFEYPWTPGKLNQRIDRAHRIGQKNTVNVWYCVAPNTIDEKIASILDSKQRILDGALDGKETDTTNLLTELIRQYTE